MDNDLSKEVVVINELGIHARTATMIAKIAQNARYEVWLKKDDNMVSASDILDILTLACAKGTKIQILIEDEEDIEVLENIVKLVKIGFGEQ